MSLSLSVLEAWERAITLQSTGTSGTGEHQLLTQGEPAAQLQIHWYLERKEIKLITRFFCPVPTTDDFQVIHVEQQKMRKRKTHEIFGGIRMASLSRKLRNPAANWNVSKIRVY